MSPNMSRNDDSLLESSCPSCEHPLGEHLIEYGCDHDWEVDAEGRAIKDGCECPLTVAQQYNPPSEQDERQ